MTKSEGIRIAKSPNQIAEEAKRIEAKRRRAADELYYQKQIEALKGGKKSEKPQVVRNVTFNLTIPSLTSVKNQLKTYATARNLKITGAMVCLVLVATAGLNIFTRDNDESPQVAGTSRTEKADFAPLVPIDSNGKAKDVKPDLCSNNAKLICFNDKYLGGQVKVTQQKLENGQKIDVSKLPEIAKSSFSETSAVDYEAVKTKNGDGVVVSYQEIGSQRAIFSSKDMLVFIESEKTYSKQQWAEYFDSLKT